LNDAESLRGRVEIVAPTAAERAVARRVAETRATVPDIEFSVQVDVGAALAAAAERSASTVALLVRASALALREHPRANGAYRDGHFELYSRVNAGVVLSDEEHHETATVLDADRKTLGELSEEIDDLRSRVDKLSASERSGATFTLAHYPVTRAGGLLAPSNAVALAAGEVREIAAVRDGTILPSRTLSLTLACDHRILYGAPAVAFLARIQDLLEHNEF
jgi:pyruvate dehydrogenase E2 component (dihydrolipoamide acetyltransferase)